MTKCSPLQQGKKKNLIQKLYAKQNNLYVPREDSEYKLCYQF